MYLIFSSIFFKPKGADRKLKTDREKIDKKSHQDREKYQSSHETTMLTEVRDPDTVAVCHLTSYSVIIGSYVALVHSCC